MTTTPLRRRPFPSLCALLVATTAASGAFATQGRETFDDPPRLYVESIAVEGAARVSPELVLSESRLIEGAFYSEAELREAARRVRRLPFVLDASFALERGSARGKLRLVLLVDEVRRFFVGGETLLTRFGDDLTLEKTLPDDRNDRFAPVAGARFFVEPYGVVFVATGDGGVQAGYTRYRLFGRQALLSVGLERAGCCSVTVPPLALDPSFSGWSSDDRSDSATVTVGVPLPARNQSLRLSASYRRTDDGRRRPVLGLSDGGDLAAVHGPDAAHFQEFTDRKAELAWIADTTDDPILPTRGRNLTAALELRELSADAGEDALFDAAGSDASMPRTMSSRLLRASLSATGHWPVGRRQTVSATVRVAAGRSRIDDLRVDGRILEDQDFDAFEAAASFRHALQVWQSPGRDRPGRDRQGRDRPAHLPAQEVWWETVVEVGYEDVSIALASLPLRRVSVTSGLTWRSAWGIFRIGLAYVDYGRAL